MSLSLRAISVQAAFINGVNTSLWQRKQDRGTEGSQHHFIKGEHSVELQLLASSHCKKTGCTSVAMSSAVNIFADTIEVLRKYTFKAFDIARHIAPDGEQSVTGLKKETCNAA